MKSFDPEDPLLTAYALGELEGEELREIEALVARDPAAARHVESIRAAAAGFGEAFEREPAPEVEPIRAVEIEPKRRTPFIPWLFYASTAAAACFFVVLVIRLADPAAMKPDENLEAEAVLQSPPPPPPSSIEPLSETSGAADRSATVGQSAGEEFRRQASDLRKEKAAAEGAAAAVAGPAERFADKTENTYESLQKRDDAYAAKSAAAPPAAKLGEMKDAARGARARENEGEMRSFDSVATVTGRDEGAGVLGELDEQMELGEMPASVNTVALLAELGLRESREAREDDLANLAQTTLDRSPMPDPESALVRAVNGFARLVEARTSATDELWDRVLADARYAAGSDPKRLAFVALVEQARALAGSSR